MSAKSSDRKVLLVTGGGRGIGAATALLAAERGYAIAVNYLQRSQEANRVAERIRAQGGMAIAVPADVSSEDDVARLFNTVDQELGPVAALVNNAGTLELQSRIENIDAGRLRRVFETNVIGSFLCAREAVRRMSTRHGGHGGSIVNISSSQLCMELPVSTLTTPPARAP